MFLQLNHQKLDAYILSKNFVKESYKVSQLLPPDERFGMISQIRRAALSVLLNISEGASRRSEVERKRFYEISRGSLIEIDAAFDVAVDLQYIDKELLNTAGELSIKIFKILTGLIKHKPDTN